ncbi:MAG: hypothetical protein WCH93_01515 [Actinomycetota bacterium]
MTGKTRFTKRELLLAVPAVVLVSCSSSDRSGTVKDGAKGVTTVVVTFLPTPGVSVSKVVDLEPSGPSLGDRLEFTVPLVMDGKPAGEMTGVLVTTRLGKGVGASAVKEERTGVMTFRLNDSDSITVNGASRVKPGKRAPEVGDPQVRDVVGGTGAYLDAEGSLRTVRNDDDSYTYTFSLRLP